MSKNFHKVLDFKVFTGQNLNSIRNGQISASKLLTVVKDNHSGVVAIKQNRPVKTSGLNSAKRFKQGEYLIGLSLTVALHLFWLVTAPIAETQETIRPPKPIMVEWLSSPQAHTEPAKSLPQSKPQPQPKRNKEKPVVPAVKPKRSPRQAALKPSKPVIAASDSVEEPIIAQASETPSAPSAVAPVNTTPVATATQPNSAPDNAPVTLPHLNADYLNNPAPDYPPDSRELDEQGRVLLRAMINADGTVAQVVLRKSSGFSRLDQAALDTVKNWRFVPARRGEQKIPAWVVVPVAFSLEG